MKRGKVLMTVLVVLAVLFASCSNGMSKDDASGASTKAVKVGLNLKGVDESSQKTVSLKEMGNNYYSNSKMGWLKYSEPIFIQN